MITATEARDIAEELATHKGLLLTKINDAIVVACREGKRNVIVGSMANEEVTREVERNGYQVNHVLDWRDGDYYDVRW